MQANSHVTHDQRIVYYESKIAELKSIAIKQYNEITLETQNITSLYIFNQRVDQLAATIIEILYYIEMKNIYRTNKQQKPLKPAYEEIAEEKREKLTIQREALKITIALLEETINAIKENNFLVRLENKLEMERFRTILQLEEVKKELRVYEEEPDLTDGEISIYLTENENAISFKGQIFLANTPFFIGDIEYRGKTNIPWLGDIGYNIEQRFRGNNYAYKALVLIKEKIMERNIEKVIITCDCDNIASQKTIEKFGGKRIDSTLDSIYRYECDLSLKLEETPKHNL